MDENTPILNSDNSTMTSSTHYCKFVFYNRHIDALPVGWRHREHHVPTPLEMFRKRYEVNEIKVKTQTKGEIKLIQP